MWLTLPLSQMPQDIFLLYSLEQNMSPKGRDQWEWIGLWKVAIDWHLVRIVVIDIIFYLNLAAILE